MAKRIDMIKIFVGLSMMGASIVSCKSSDSNSMSGSLPSLEPGNGVVDDSGGFYVRAVASSGVTAYTHSFAGFGDECKISPTDSGQDVRCLTHIREHDLYANGLSFEINVPTTMCKYLWEMPYFYYNFEPGTGPKSISVMNDADTGAMLNCTVDSAPGVVTGNVCYFPNNEGSISSDGAVSCAYDHSDDGGPNCCSGDYAIALTSRTAKDGGGFEYSTTNSSGKYGGGHGKCVGGPILKNNWPIGKSGYPEVMVENVDGTGKNKKYTVASPLSVYGGTSNLFATNFFDWVAYKSGTYAAATRPQAIRPVDDRSGGTDTILPGRDSFEYRCYDEAGELKNRIRMYVVEWDSSEAFQTYLASEGVSGSPESTGADGTDCDAGGSVGDSGCDDFLDWSSFMTGFPSEVER